MVVECGMIFVWNVFSAIHGVLNEALNCVSYVLLMLGFAPSEQRVAKVMPLFNHGDECLLNSCNPVSILPVFSKVSEKLMYKRLVAFENKQGILYKYKFGFKENFGTNQTLIISVDNS